MAYEPILGAQELRLDSGDYFEVLEVSLAETGYGRTAAQPPTKWRWRFFGTTKIWLPYPASKKVRLADKALAQPNMASST